MTYKNKTEQWLYEMNRPGAKLEGLVPTPRQYRNLKNKSSHNDSEYGNKLRRKYTGIMQAWKSKSPSTRASALNKIFQTGNKFNERSSFQARRLSYGYANIRNMSEADTREKDRQNLVSDKYVANRGSAYSGKLQNVVKRYLSFMQAEKGAVYAEPSEVKDVLEVFDVYDDDGGKWWVVTDKRLPAKNGSPRGRSLYARDKAQYPTEQKVYDELRKQNAQYDPAIDRENARRGVDSITGF